MPVISRAADKPPWLESRKNQVNRPQITAFLQLEPMPPQSTESSQIEVLQEKNGTMMPE
jgi:hypothetical protein